MKNIIGVYETMDRLSSEMVVAARCNDWDRLVDLEKNVARLRYDLCGREAPPSLLTAEERALKVNLIHRILDADAEVRRHTEPWLAQVRKFLSAGAREAAVHRAYGA